MKFQNNGIKNLKEFYNYSRNIAKSGINPLNSKIPFNQSYVTDLLQSMINSGYELKAVPIEHGWLELDTFNDYQLYQKLYESKQLTKFIKLIKN